MKEPLLAKFTEDSQKMNHALMHSHPGKWFKELHPPEDLNVLFNTAELNPNAEVVDQERWTEVTQISRHEQDLVLPYNIPMARPTIDNGVHASRFLCDKLASGNITLDEYLVEFYELKENLNSCEENDPRFKEEVPMPKDVPQWANPTLYKGII